jgi:hypothetical protein
VTVAVKTANDIIRVEVTDLSGPGCRSRVLLAVMRKTAGGSISLPPCGAVGVAAARRADGDLVRDTGFIAADATFRGVR